VPVPGGCEPVDGVVDEPVVVGLCGAGVPSGSGVVTVTVVVTVVVPDGTVTVTGQLVPVALPVPVPVEPEPVEPEPGEPEPVEPVVAPLEPDEELVLLGSVAWPVPDPEAVLGVVSTVGSVWTCVRVVAGFSAVSLAVVVAVASPLGWVAVAGVWVAVDASSR
jgi:hypothetical protein